MTEIQRVLANNIRKYRKQKGLTQIGLSNLCEISTNYIGLIETHRNFPSPKMIELIAEKLDVKSPELFCIEASNENIETIVQSIGASISSLSSIMKELSNSKIHRDS
ncbi:MAG: helix-turn-helix transcriptional regulator [Bacteroidetes bacterium]|nr:helix-turn-helix transcriptional regulator [Bacteroidota bacterium]